MILQRGLCRALVCASFLLSFVSVQLPVLSELSSGTRTILLTVVIAAVGAYFFPVKEDDGTKKKALERASDESDTDGKERG